jgi:hypothetical protein
VSNPLEIDLSDPDVVIAALTGGAEANSESGCRRGSIDVIESPGRLIATGDLHDNPLHIARVVEAARLDGDDPAHLTLHEIIHSDRLMGGMDFSYRALARVAALKSAHPERVHTLQANHELAQIVGQGIVKDGVRVVEAFNEGVEYSFGERAGEVTAAIDAFIRSMPLALRCRCGDGDVLCAHSLPSPGLMDRFDPGVLERDLEDADYVPREGSAHLMVWGRRYDAGLIELLMERWGVKLFILGHEKAENGYALVDPAAVVLNSDHERGVYLKLDLGRVPGLMEIPANVRSLGASLGA